PTPRSPPLHLHDALPIAADRLSVSIPTPGPNAHPVTTVCPADSSHDARFRTSPQRPSRNIPAPPAISFNTRPAPFASARPGSPPVTQASASASTTAPKI